MLDMLTKPAKMQQAVDQLTGFIERIELLLKSIDDHLANIETNTKRDS